MIRCGFGLISTYILKGHLIYTDWAFNLACLKKSSHMVIEFGD